MKNLSHHESRILFPMDRVEEAGSRPHAESVLRGRISLEETRDFAFDEAEKAWNFFQDQAGPNWDAELEKASTPFLEGILERFEYWARLWASLLSLIDGMDPLSLRENGKSLDKMGRKELHILMYG